MFLEDLSNFIFSYDYSHTRCEDIDIVKVAFLDYFGVTYRGFKESSSQVVLRSFDEILGGVGDFSLKSSIVGCLDCECDVLTAGLVNGVSSHVLELDDGHRLAHMHLGSVIFSAALPLAESLDVSGKDFLVAVILGYKVGILFGKFVNPDHRNNGFHTTGTVGSLVAGVVASKLLNLDEDMIVNALGLCVTQSSGLLESDHGGSMAKALHVGRAVQTAIMSAFLAKNGFTGASSIIEGDEGFLNSMVFINRSYDDGLNQILGNLEDVKLNDIYFKVYPFCRHLHSTIDLVLKLRRNVCISHDISSIECLVVKTYDIASKHDNYNISNREELKQSMPYAVAIAWVCGNVDIDTVDRLINQGLFKKDSDVDEICLIKKLVDKIVIRCDDKLNSFYPEKRPASICVKVDGEVFSDYTFVAKGDIQNPLEVCEIVDKFMRLNPDYDILKFCLVDNIEDYNMGYVVCHIK